MIKIVGVGNRKWYFKEYENKKFHSIFGTIKQIYEKSWFENIYCL